MKKIILILLILYSTINSFPDTAIKHFYLANEYFSNGEYRKAIDEFSNAIKSDNNFAFAYINRSNCYISLKKYNKALKDLETAIKINPNESTAYNLVGIINKNKKNYKEAIINYTKAIEINPDSYLAYNNRAIAYYFIKDYKKSLIDYNKAISLDPNNAYYYFIHLYISYKNSKDELDKSMKIMVKSIDFFKHKEWEYSIASFLKGTITEKQLLKKAGNNKEKLCEFYFYAGCLYLFNKQQKKANLYFEKCLRTKIKHFIEYEFALKELLTK